MSISVTWTDVHGTITTDPVIDDLGDGLVFTDLSLGDITTDGLTTADVVVFAPLRGLAAGDQLHLTSPIVVRHPGETPIVYAHLADIRARGTATVPVAAIDSAGSAA